MAERRSPQRRKLGCRPELLELVRRLLARLWHRAGFRTYWRMAIGAIPIANDISRSLLPPVCRKLLWLGVTAHPSAEWIALQLTEARLLYGFLILARCRNVGASVTADQEDYGKKRGGI
jgi:hypothetical protein